MSSQPNIAVNIGINGAAAFLCPPTQLSLVSSSGSCVCSLAAMRTRRLRLAEDRYCRALDRAREAAARGDGQTARAWSRLARSIDRVIKNLEFIGDEPQPLHKDKGYTRESALKLRAETAMRWMRFTPTKGRGKGTPFEVVWVHANRVYTRVLHHIQYLRRRDGYTPMHPGERVARNLVQSMRRDLKKSRRAFA